MFPVIAAPAPLYSDPLQSMQAAVKDYAPVSSGIALPPVVSSQSLALQQQAQSSRARSALQPEAESAPVQQQVVNSSRQFERLIDRASGFAAQLFAQSAEPDADGMEYQPRFRPLVASEGVDMRRSGRINVLTYNAPPYEAIIASEQDPKPYFTRAASAYQQATGLLQ